MDISLYDFDDYKNYLNDFADSQPRGFRKQIAEAAQCQTAYVTHVLSGNAHFGWEQAEAISNLLNHSDSDKEYFLLLLEYSKTQKASLKKFLKQRMQNLKSKILDLKERISVEKISAADEATYYSAWYFSAIHVMVTIPQLQSKEALMKALQLPGETAQKALDALVKMGLLIKKGNQYQTTTKHIHLHKDSPLISKHHANWRLQALRSVDNEKENDLHFSSVFTLSEKDAQKIKTLLVKSIEESVKVIRKSPEEKTFALTADFFEI